MVKAKGPTWRMNCPLSKCFWGPQNLRQLEMPEAIDLTDSDDEVSVPTSLRAMAVGD